MANMAAKLVSQYFESKDTKAAELREDVLRVGWGFKGGSIEIFFAFDEEGTHVHLEGMNFIKVPQEKYDAIYKVLNECNYTYKHVKFVLDTSDGQISARDDAIIQLDTCGPECFELMIRMVQIVEDAYPMFMKAMWV